METIGRPADHAAARFWVGAPRPYVSVTISPTGDVFEKHVNEAVARNLRDAGFVGTLAKHGVISHVQIFL
jgi:hypothetical protein